MREEDRPLSVTEEFLLSTVYYLLSWIREMLDERFENARVSAYYSACSLKAWHSEACQRAIFEIAHSKIRFSDLGKPRKGENDDGK